MSFWCLQFLKKKNLLGQKYFVCFLQELKERKTNRHLKSTDLYIGCRVLVKFLNPGQGEAVLVNYPDFRNNWTISFLNFPISGLPWHSQQIVAFLDDYDFPSHFYRKKLVDPTISPNFLKAILKNRTNLIAAGRNTIKTRFIRQ